MAGDAGQIGAPASIVGHAMLADGRLRRLLDVLGGSDAARIVGGAVRNALLGLPVSDIDVATVHPPDEVTRRLEAAGIRAVPTGITHGTVTAVIDGEPFEVTTLRADVETDGRRATVAFTDDWAVDAGRRDFTVNALYADAEGRVFDPTGGIADLRERRIRFIGSPEARVREDYLRILRFFRFFAWYGAGRPDADGLKATARLKRGLAVLSPERVWSEVRKLLAARDPPHALLWMRTSGILQKVLPESWGIDAVPQLVAAEARFGWEPDPLLRLLAMLPPHRGRMEALADRLRLSNAERARLVAFAEAPEPAPDADLRSRARTLYLHGEGGVVDRLRLALARAAAAGAGAPEEAFRDSLDHALRWERPRLPVTGADLVGSGVPPGPGLGRLLRALERRWIDSGFTLDRDALLASAHETP